MKVGDQVVIVRDNYGDRNGYEVVGRSGEIVHKDTAHLSLGWDVKLDEALPDGREFLWFGTSELQVTEAAG